MVSKIEDLRAMRRQGVDIQLPVWRSALAQFTAQIPGAG
jgi:hypothetical protein